MLRIHQLIAKALPASSAVADRSFCLRSAAAADAAAAAGSAVQMPSLQDHSRPARGSGHTARGPADVWSS